MEIDLISKLVHDYLESRLLPNQNKEEQNTFFSYEDKILEIYTLREGFTGDVVKFPIAKAKRIQSKGVWKVYCMGQSLTWTLYKPYAEVKDINEFLKVLDDDHHGIFWG